MSRIYFSHMNPFHLQSHTTKRDAIRALKRARKTIPRRCQSGDGYVVLYDSAAGIRQVVCPAVGPRWIA